MTTVPEVLASTWDRNILFSVTLELTFACNLDCSFCYNDRTQQATPLSAAEYCLLLDELADLEVLHITLSGGEPLAHPRFFEIGSYARVRGFAIRIKSNGHAILPEVAARIRHDLDPFMIDLSLHGATPASHDRQTRRPGSFERLLANIRYMIEVGLRLRLICTLTRWNEHEVEAMIRLSEKLGVPMSFSPLVTPRDSGDLTPLDHCPSPEGVQRLHQALSRNRLSRAETDRRPVPALESPDVATDEPAEPPSTKCCGAASSSVTIDPYGNVLPCVQWRRPLGSLREASFRAIWEGSPEIRRIRTITESVKANGGAVVQCGPLTRTCPALFEMLDITPSRQP